MLDVEDAFIVLSSPVRIEEEHADGRNCVGGVRAYGLQDQDREDFAYRRTTVRIGRAPSLQPTRYTNAASRLCVPGPSSNTDRSEMR